MNRTPNSSTVVLVGMRGCGKSTVGAAVAAAMGVRFVDLDAATLARCGFASVAEFWKAKGQSAFRAAEVATLHETLDSARVKKERLVVALGGGTPTAPGARELLDARGSTGEVVTVYLRCSLETLRARLARTLAVDANRPSVTGAGALEELEDLLRAREPVYRAVSEAVVDADGLTVEAIADLVIQAASR